MGGSQTRIQTRVTSPNHAFGGQMFTLFFNFCIIFFFFKIPSLHDNILLA